ncbi:MAG: hypothetical protein AAB732_02910 [Patescibacteria group bacterium]
MKNVNISAYGRSAEGRKNQNGNVKFKINLNKNPKSQINKSTL